MGNTIYHGDFLQVRVFGDCIGFMWLRVTYYRRECRLYDFSSFEGIKVHCKEDQSTPDIPANRWAVLLALIRLPNLLTRSRSRR